MAIRGVRIMIRVILILAIFIYILFAFMNQVGIVVEYPQCLFSGDPVLCRTIIEAGKQ
jgi:hypothetical protein